MNLGELQPNQLVNIQIIWGEKVIGFASRVIFCGDGGVYVEPYKLNGQHLELNVKMSSHILCHMFVDDAQTGKRVSWRNIELQTVYKNKQMRYFLFTAAFNHLSNEDDRRAHGRIRVNHIGKLTDYNGVTTNVMIYDISEGGIAFLAPKGYIPNMKPMVVTFSPNLKNAKFNIKVTCKVVHYSDRSGSVFCGCEITEDSHEFLLYGSILRMNKLKEAQEQEE